MFPPEDLFMGVCVCVSHTHALGRNEGYIDVPHNLICFNSKASQSPCPFRRKRKDSLSANLAWKQRGCFCWAFHLKRTLYVNNVCYCSVSNVSDLQTLASNSIQLFVILAVIIENVEWLVVIQFCATKGRAWFSCKINK